MRQDEHIYYEARTGCIVNCLPATREPVRMCCVDGFEVIVAREESLSAAIEAHERWVEVRHEYHV